MRWRRAMRLLQAAPGTRVLDVGCAFGFGTRLLSRAYDCVGVDGSPSFVARAVREVPAARFVQARAEALPFVDDSFDAAVCLEVLEHLDAEAPAVSEMRRVLRPDGELVVSVPHAGLLQAFDSLNVHLCRTGCQVSFPLGEVPSGSRWHRHYSLTQLEDALEGFAVDKVVRTGLGLAEPVNSLLLRSKHYARLQNLYFALAVADDELPAGRRAYNLMIHARKIG